MRLQLSLPALLLLLLLGPVRAETPRSGISDYVRVVKGPITQLQTAVVTLRGPKGQRLDLVSAVHLADFSYYQDLNTRFRGYQTVLYELVLPEKIAGQRLPSKLGNEGALSGAQATLARSLGLTTQLEKIDYSAPNFVHADLSQEALSRTMETRNESLLSYFQKAMSNSSKVTDLGVTEAELGALDVMALMRGEAKPQDRKTLKKLMSTVLTSSDGVMASLEDTAVVAERNKAALRALDQSLASGSKKLALFYGAAHMPVLELKLKREGWTRTEVSWLPAWTF